MRPGISTLQGLSLKSFYRYRFKHLKTDLFVLMSISGVLSITESMKGLPFFLDLRCNYKSMLFKMPRALAISVFWFIFSRNFIFSSCL
jgi:predicted membrane channel-forming protein YqfA (hemolysin III family)